MPVTFRSTDFQSHELALIDYGWQDIAEGFSKIRIKGGTIS